jgi:hypothetical protein
MLGLPALLVLLGLDKVSFLDGNVSFVPVKCPILQYFKGIM